MQRRLQFLLALVLCAGLTTFTFTAAQAQAQKPSQTQEVNLNAQRAPASIMSVSDRAPATQLQNLVPGAVGIGHDAFNGVVASFPFDDVTDVTELVPFSFGPFPGAGAISDDADAGYFITGTVLYSFDATSGDSTMIGDLSTTFNFSGMAYDESTDTYYGATADFGSTTPSPGSLYTIDVSTGTATLVGELTGTVVPVGIATDDNGSLYAVDREDDNLYEIDTSTGAGTLVGPIGFDSNFDQGLTYDSASGNLYFAAINAGAGNSPEVHTIDISTGTATLVGTFANLRQFGWLGGQDFSGVPNLSVSGADFGTVSTGGSATQSVTLNNNGAADLSVTDLSVSGDAAFSIDSPPTTPFTIPSGGSETVDVTFAPTSAGDFTGTLAITSNDDGTAGTVTSVDLSGSGFAPLASIDENFDDLTLPALPEGWTVANVNGDDFTWQTDDGKSNSAPNAANIRYNPNVAMDDWLFTAPVELTGGTTYRVQFAYAAESSSFPENLEVKFGDAASPGAMNDPALFSEVEFANETFEDASATFTPASDGVYYVGFHGFSAANQFDIYVDDVVVEEAPDMAQFVVDPDTVAFGSRLTTTLASDSINVEVQNNGGASLTVEQPTITGTDASAFVVEDDTSSYPADLEASEMLGFDVGLDPSLSAGVYEAMLEIGYDDGSGSQTAEIPVSVTVVNPNFGGPIAGYFYANNADDSPDFNEPTVVSLDIPDGNETDVTAPFVADDEAFVGPEPIGFDFTYFGQTYDSFCLYANGLLHLLNNGDACPTNGTLNFFSNDPIPTADVPNNIIAFYWDDLAAGDGPSSVEALYGNDADGNLVVSFEDYGFFAGSPTEFLSMDLVLYDDSGSENDRIRIQYYEFGADADTTSATVGIENADGTEGVEYRFGEEGGPLQVAGDTLALMFGPEPSALPVELDGFTATASDGGVDLAWQTLSETANRGFSVEMKRTLTSADGSQQPSVQWQEVGFVESTAPGGTSVEAQSYSLRVPDLAFGQYTFRLRQVDLDGNDVLTGEPVEASIGLEGAYELSGTYPNPFRDQTTFEVAVREAQQVTVEVYDVLGRRVMEVYDGVLEAGQPQTIQIEARGLASGVYFYRVSGEDFTASRKMMLVR